MENHARKSSPTLIPGCVYHSTGLVAMRESTGTQTTGFERQESVIQIWECEVPECHGLYNHTSGYHKAKTEEKPHSRLSGVWINETLCLEHILPMVAVAEQNEVITFRCPIPVCDKHVFVPRGALSFEP
jgi:hypothetical protein